MLRKTVFWIHLVCGVAAGVVVLMMSVTGVLLTYERQTLAVVDRSHYADPPADAQRRPLVALLDAAKLYRPDLTPTALTVRSDPRAPVTIAAGRDAALHANPYTGDVVEQGGARARAFLAAVTGWHRWFNASGEQRAAARRITGASNLAFLFLVLSGIYLWLPRAFKWAAFKTRLLLNPRATSAKARDFNWHHVFGIWSAVPLAVVVATAVVFSYPWANDLVYRSVGEQPPQRGSRGGPDPVATSISRGEDWGGTASAAVMSYDELFERAAAQAGNWRSLTLTLPAGGNAAELRFNIDEGNGGQPQRRHSLALDAKTGEVVTWAPFSSQSTGQKARSWIRFLHTGEALGVAGQTVAGLVSLTSTLMVWTGLALAYRRLLAPLWSRLKPRRVSAL